MSDPEFKDASGREEKSSNRQHGDGIGVVRISQLVSIRREHERMEVVSETLAHV